MERDNIMNDTGVLISHWTSELRKDYPASIPGCKFKVGDVVKYIGKNTKYSQHQREQTYLVTSLAMEDDNLFELSLGGFPYLVWDYEIEFAEYVCSYCGTNNKGKQNCEKCGAPYKFAAM